MLKIYFSKRLALIATVLFAGIFCLGIFAISRFNEDTPLPVRILVWVITPAMLWGAIAYLKWLLNPPLMYRVDSGGVMIYRDNDQLDIPDQKGVFLPWNIVTNICYEKRIAIGGSGKLVSVPVIKCTLSEDAPFSTTKHSVGYQSDDGNRVVCLDAFNGHITKQTLLDQIKPYWQAARRA